MLFYYSFNKQYSMNIPLYMVTKKIIFGFFVSITKKLCLLLLYHWNIWFLSCCFLLWITSCILYSLWFVLCSTIDAFYTGNIKLLTIFTLKQLQSHAHYTIESKRKRYSYKRTIVLVDVHDPQNYVNQCMKAFDAYITTFLILCCLSKMAYSRFFDLLQKLCELWSEYILSHFLYAPHSFYTLGLYENFMPSKFKKHSIH